MVARTKGFLFLGVFVCLPPLPSASSYDNTYYTFPATNSGGPVEPFPTSECIFPFRVGGLETVDLRRQGLVFLGSPLQLSLLQAPLTEGGGGGSSSRVNVTLPIVERLAVNISASVMATYVYRASVRTWEIAADCAYVPSKNRSECSFPPSFFASY